MRIGKNVGVVLFGAVLACSGGEAALAHHSFGAEFDYRAPLVLDGTVTRFDWRNPHSEIHLDVLNHKTGQIEHWRIEGGAPSALLRQGWNRDSLPAGTRVVVRAFRAWDGDNRASAAEITFPGGTRMSLANPKAEAAAAAAAREHVPDE